MDPRHMMTLINDYNNSPDKYSDQEAEAIALMAQQIGGHFKRSSKPIRKLAFEVADTAAFGFLPDEWRPTTRGESVYGESAIDKIASGAGMLGGLALGIGGLAKGYKAATTVSKAGHTPLQKAIGVTRDRLAMNPTYHAGRAKLQTAGARMGATPLAQAGSRQFNKAVKSLSENLLISEQTARRILMGTGAVGGAAMVM